MNYYVPQTATDLMAWMAGRERSAGFVNNNILT
jgi:hypothetical protein